MKLPKYLARSRGAVDMIALAAVAVVAIGVGVYFVYNSHAGGAGSYYVSPLTTPKNITVTRMSNGVAGIIVTWDRPPDYAKIHHYELLRSNYSIAGTFGTDGAETPARTSGGFFGYFKDDEILKLQSVATSVPASFYVNRTGGVTTSTATE